MSSAWDGLEHSLRRTELPHYAVNAATPEDAFYTERAVASECVKTFKRVCRKHGIDLRGRVFIEPSAGEGCFHDFLDEPKIGLDINPGRRGIRKADFLTWAPESMGQPGFGLLEPGWESAKKYVVIGNPPFGHRGAIALAFLKRAFLFADVVGFILPMSFYSNGKGSNMKRAQTCCPEGASLLHSEFLDAEAFYHPTLRSPMSVRTVFQVWAKGRGASVFADYDVSEYAEMYTCCSAPSRYCGLGRGRAYDCFIASTFYKSVGIVHDFADVQYGSGYGFVLKKRKREILRLLRGADWERYSSLATNHCRHIRMFHLRRLLGENGFGKVVG